MASPLAQFEIKKIIPIEILGYDISFTNSSLAMLVTVLSISVFMFLGLRNLEIIPSKTQSILENSYEFKSSSNNYWDSELFDVKRNVAQTFMGVEIDTSFGSWSFGIEYFFADITGKERVSEYHYGTSGYYQYSTESYTDYWGYPRYRSVRKYIPGEPGYYTYDTLSVEDEDSGVLLNFGYHYYF